MNREPDEEVAYFIQITTLCQALNCLPGPGGLLQQDSYIMYGVEAVLIAQAKKHDMDMAEKTRS
jgi:uncharacterized membrane protein